MLYTLEDFINQTYPHPPEMQQLGIRRGQHMANVLQENKPYLLKQARNAGVDPFYDDAKIPEFLAYIGTRWESMV